MSPKSLFWNEVKHVEAAPEKLLRRRLMWVMGLRVLYTTLLLGATILVQWQDRPLLLDPALLTLYGIIAGTYLLTFIYGLLFARVRPQPFAQVQMALDTLQVTLIIYVTGGYGSVFSFLYLVVIIYSSIFMGRAGILIIAAICSVQYGTLLGLEYFEVLPSFDTDAGLMTGQVQLTHVVFKVAMTALACFVVAMLSGLLSEQERRTQKELHAVREHMKRVQKMAAIGEMSSRLAHEIKNPLAALVGSVKLLQEDLPPDPGVERLTAIILREADRLNTLVTEFLNFARPVSGNPQPLHLESAISEVLTLFEKDEEVKSRVLITARFKPELWIPMDRSHFQQVFWNLLTNAAESIDGPGSIHISADSAPENTAAVRVRDTGKGMDEETMQVLFEPFFTTKPKGSGLGLSIVHRIVEAYDFRLDVDSLPDRGSTFTLVARRVPPPGKHL